MEPISQTLATYLSEVSLDYGAISERRTKAVLQCMIHRHTAQPIIESLDDIQILVNENMRLKAALERKVEG